MTSLYKFTRPRAPHNTPLYLAMVPESEAFVIPLFVQAIMFGSYMASLVHCLRWLVYDDEGWTMRKKINWGMLIITIVVFLFTAANLGISLQMTLGFFSNEDLLTLNKLSISNVCSPKHGW
jgi:hypothetical protein